MLQTILTFQFDLNQEEDGEIEPEFRPIQLYFINKTYNEDNFTELIDRDDLFSTFYQHTTGILEVKAEYSNLISTKLKNTPFQVSSFFKQEIDGTQFVTLLIFEFDDELEIFEFEIKRMGENLGKLFTDLLRAKNTRKLDLIESATSGILNELKFTAFQIDRLSNLTKLQKVGLIFKSKERLEILNALRERPYSRRELRSKIEKTNPNISLDILLDPFIELNLIRRDWIQGDRKKDDEKRKIQGEYIFLIKDLALTLIPNEIILELIRQKEEHIYERYKKRVDGFFSQYNIKKQIETDSTNLAAILLKPDVYDFFNLMRNNYYPLDKIPKILSSWASVDEILEELQELNILTVIEDEKKRKWLLLLAEIHPIIFFPEYILPKIRAAYKSKAITHEIAKKAYDLLEVTYPEMLDIK